MLIQDFEIFRYGENIFTDFHNKDKTYKLNRSPYLDIVLTDRCNSNCQFCIADLIHHKLDLDFDVLKQKVAYAYNEMNVREALLIGGEPTKSDILLETIGFLNHIGFTKIVMTTNGIELVDNPTLLETAIDLGLTNINLSIMSLDANKQLKIGGRKKGRVITIGDIKSIYKITSAGSIGLRINSNIFKDCNDSLLECVGFYKDVARFCDSIKFSPLFAVDNFSVINTKTEWVRDNILSDEQYESLFSKIENYYKTSRDISIIENYAQFGFVKNTMIPLSTPIILNWNFGKYTGMAKRVTEHNEINNIKLLPNGELSLSWNRESTEYYIDTNIKEQ